MYEVTPGFYSPVDGTGNTFTPNVFVDISDTFREKVTIMLLYNSGIETERSQERSITLKTYALYRGNCIGVKYAESFMLLFLKESFAV